MCEDVLWGAPTDSANTVERDRLALIALRAEVAMEPDNSQHLCQVDRYREALQTITAIAKGDTL